MKKKKEEKRSSIYRISRREKAKLLLTGLLLGLLISWLCYHSLLAIPVALPVAAFYQLVWYREKIEDKRMEMRLHFRDFLTAVHMAVRSGYSLENAVRSGYRDLTSLYGAGDGLALELANLIRQMEYRTPVEKLFRDLGRRTEIEEIRSFGELVMITKRTGGNLGKALSDTWRILNRRIDTEQEIRTLIAAKKYEQSIMSLMPAGMILYLRFSFPGFVENLYGNLTGVCIMTAALITYLGAFALGRKMVRIEV